MKAVFAALPILVMWSATTVFAGEANVLDVKATCSVIRTCDFDVKVLHADVGFSHYADRYEVLTPDGVVLGVRVLQHPHVHEQPFVRRLVGVEIPEDVTEVTVRARDSQHGHGGRTVRVEIEIPVKSDPPPQARKAEPPGLAAGGRISLAGSSAKSAGLGLTGAIGPWYDPGPVPVLPTRSLACPPAHRFTHPFTHHRRIRCASASISVTPT